MKLASVQHVTTPSGSPDPKLIRPQQAKTESYLQGTENRKLGSAARDGVARLEEQRRTETAATALTWSALRSGRRRQ